MFAALHSFSVKRWFFWTLINNNNARKLIWYYSRTVLLKQEKHSKEPPSLLEPARTGDSEPQVERNQYDAGERRVKRCLCPLKLECWSDSVCFHEWKIERQWDKPRETKSWPNNLTWSQKWERHGKDLVLRESNWILPQKKLLRL